MTTKELLDEMLDDLCIEYAFGEQPDSSDKVEKMKQEIIKELEASIRKDVVNECLEILKGVESYCIQPTGYCSEEQEKEIYLTGFDDMRAFKIIKLLNRIKE